MLKTIYCIYCDTEKEFKWFNEEMQDLAKFLSFSKDTVPKLACRKCLGYRRRKKRRDNGETYPK